MLVQRSKITERIGGFIRNLPMGGLNNRIRRSHWAHLLHSLALGTSHQPWRVFTPENTKQLGELFAESHNCSAIEAKARRFHGGFPQ
jgi:hypothetical protein